MYNLQSSNSVLQSFNRKIKEKQELVMSRIMLKKRRRSLWLRKRLLHACKILPAQGYLTLTTRPSRK